MSFKLATFTFLIFLLYSASTTEALPDISLETVKQLEQKFQTEPLLSAEELADAETQIETVRSTLQKAADLNQRRADLMRTYAQAPKDIKVLQQKNKTDSSSVVNFPTDATKEELEKKLLAIIVELDANQQRLVSLEKESKELSTQRGELPAKLATAKTRLSELQSELNLQPPDTLTEQLSYALMLANIKEAEAEIQLLQSQLDTFETMRTRVSLRIDERVHKAAYYEQLRATYQHAVDQRRKEESEESARQAEEALQKAVYLHPLVLTIAEKNAELASLRAGPEGLTANIQKTTDVLQQTEQLTLAVTRRAQELDNRLEAVGLTHAIAQLLRREQVNLPNTAARQAKLKQLKSEISRVQLALLDLDDQRADIRPIGAAVNRTLKTAALTAEQEKKIRPILTDYLLAQQQQVDILLEEYNNYLILLADLDTAERELIKATATFSTDIAEYILWVQSDPSPSIQALWKGLLAFPALLKEGLSALVTEQSAKGFNFKPLWWILFFFIESTLVMLHRICRRRITAIVNLMRKIRTDRLSYTFETIFYTLIIALPIPLVLGFLSVQLKQVEGFTNQINAASQAFYFTALLLLAHLYTYESLRKDGLAIAHFEWEAATIPEIRRILRRIIFISHPLFWLTVFLHFISDHVAVNWLERICLISIQILLLISAFQAFRNNGRIMGILREKVSCQRLIKFRALIQLSTAGIPFIIALMSLIGFHYTAIRTAGWFTQSIALTLIVVGVESLSVRAIRLISKRTEFQRRIKERQEQAAVETAESEKSGRSEIQEPEEISYLALNEDTTKLLRVSTGFALLIGLWFIWKEAIPALAFLDRVTLWHVKDAIETTALKPITLQNLCSAIIVGTITIASGRHLPSFIELVLLRKLPIALGERYAISTLIRYVVIGIGASFFFNLLGLKWNQIQWLVAALSVGLGFGLQEIFANFISGLIILFERPIRVCDYVTVNGTSGQVTRIQMRATTITDWDNKELLIPNKQFVTGELVNWTLTNSVLRVVIPVGIAYGSDTQKATEILTSIGRNFYLAIDKPPPEAVFREFGDSSLNFELRVFIRAANQFMEAHHELHMAIDNAFRKAGISIAFPQLDIHVYNQQESANGEKN